MQDQAIEMTLKLIQDNLTYFNGNDVIETLIDPYVILSSIYLQQNRLQESKKYVDKAESLVRALNGELNDKMIEIYSLSMQLFMLQQKYPEAFQCTQRRTALSRAVHGDDSEITLTFFEEEVLFARDLQ